MQAEQTNKEEPVLLENIGAGSESVKSLTSQMGELAVSADPSVVIAPPNSTEDSNSGDPIQDIDKRIRALKKKVLTMQITFSLFMNENFLLLGYFTMFKNIKPTRSFYPKCLTKFFLVLQF